MLRLFINDKKTHITTLALLLLIVTNSFSQLDSAYKVKYLYNGGASGSHYASHNLTFNSTDSTFQWTIINEHKGCFLSYSRTESQFSGKYHIDNKSVLLFFSNPDSLSKILIDNYSLLKIKKSSLKASTSEKTKRSLGQFYIHKLRNEETQKKHNKNGLNKAFRIIRTPFTWGYYKGIYPILKPKIIKPKEVT